MKTESNNRTPATINQGSVKDQTMVQLQEHDARLKKAMEPLLDDLSLPEDQKQALLDAASDRFVIDKDDTIKGLGLFESPDEFFKSRVGTLSTDDTPQSRQKAREIKKQKLYGDLALAAKNGDQRLYRQLRQEYATL